MELTRIRIGTDITMSVSLSDSGIKLSWDGVEVKHVVLYSDAQRIQAGRGEYLIDPSDPELMQVKYKAGQQCYLGAYRLVVQFVLQAGDSEGRTYTADVPCFELVATTEEVGNVPSSGDDDVIGLHLDLESIDSSLVQEIIDACINAAETANKAAEAANETDRIATNNEAERVESESKRKYNESVRITNEKARQDAEALRLTGEKERAQAETGRVNAESSRVSAEDSRATAEDGRAEAEKGRAESESLRMAAENKRVEAETGRSESETKRTAAESERAEAELLRARSESDRSSAETLRQEAESVRSQAEAGRVAAENGRVSAEEIRVGAEQEREKAEALRQEAETKRQEDTSAAITAANEAAAAANDAASNVDTEQLVPRIRNLEEQMPNKQETLVSGENIKTVNGENVLGSGDIRIDLSLYKVVESLPETDIDPNKIYLVINTSGTDSNEYTEYGYIDGKWEELGTYRATVDLTPYMKKEDADRTYATKTELSGKQPLLAPGKDIGISSENVISYTGSKQLYTEAESLPESPEEEYKDRIYLVPAEYPTESSVYDKYIWVADAGGTGHWEQFTGGGNGAVLVLDDLFNNSLTYAGDWNEEFEQKIGATLEQIKDIIRRDGQIIVRHKMPIPPDAEVEGVVIQDNSSLIPCMASIIGMSMTEGETSGTIEYIMITGIESGLGDYLSSSDNWNPAIYSVYFQSQEVNGEFSGVIFPLAMGSKYLTNDSIENSLYSDAEDKALAASAGKELNGKIQDNTERISALEEGSLKEDFVISREIDLSDVNTESAKKDKSKMETILGHTFDEIRAFCAENGGRNTGTIQSHRMPIVITDTNSDGSKSSGRLVFMYTYPGSYSDKYGLCYNAFWIDYTLSGGNVSTVQYIGYNPGPIPNWNDTTSGISEDGGSLWKIPNEGAVYVVREELRAQIGDVSSVLEKINNENI